MKKFLLAISLCFSSAIVLVSCDKDDDYVTPTPPANNDVAVNRGAGDSATVVVSMNQFRTIAGAVVNTAPGASGGRREVNWDGVADSSAANFFNLTAAEAPAGRKRGLVYFPSDVLLRTSLTNFSNIEPTYANQFKAFSKPRLFNSDATNLTEIRFKVPGTNVDAFVKAIGIVFTDVDNANATTVEIFDGNTSLGFAKAQPSNGQFSFVGLSTTQGKITRVKIVTGNGVLAAGVKDVSDGGTKDLVVMDDFIYSEPVAIP
ncbi:MAG: hypothetical protein EOO04_18110 [Chitinophagaceae bacterium]|nr:MAG: hypothetical protein EOO04_18110 [Chitinophagaceae bacterium]